MSRQNFMKQEKLAISAIVTNYNGWEMGLLEDFFRKFLKNDYKNFEIFLVDNASLDNSVGKVKKKFGMDKRLRTIQNPINLMSSGINMALEKAKGEYILFLNNDIYFEEGSLKKMLDYLNKNPKVAAVQGKILSFYDHKKIDDVGETMDIYGNPQTLGHKEDDRGQYENIRDILSATGAACLMRASVLDKVGLLDPDFGIGYEDMDLSLRLHLSGYTIRYLPKTLIYHRRGASVSKSSEKIRSQIKFDFNKNRLATIIKNYQLKTLLKTLPIVLGLYIVAGIVEIIYKRIWGFGLSRFQAIKWVIINMPNLLEKRKRVQDLRKLDDEVALLPFMAENRIWRGLITFIQSKKW